MVNLIENTLANYQYAQANRIKKYLTGIHAVLNRPDFTVNDETFTTAKIVLRSIDNIVDFLSGYVCGNPVGLSADDEAISTMANTIFRKGFYAKTDYEIAKNLTMYGNSYEYVYMDNGKVKSKIINNTDSFPIYENGMYSKFIEKYCVNPLTDDQFTREYTNESVKEYKNGVLIGTYNNATGLPIHYTSGDLDVTNIFGQGVVGKLIPIMNYIEQMLSKMFDSVNTLSLNPLLAISGQRIDENTNANATGQTLNLDDGSDAKYVVSNLDYNSIKLILDNLIQQFYTIANVPSTLFNSGNIANVSETSLSLLFNNTSNYAKRIAINMQQGFITRLEYWSKLMRVDLSNVDITFNFNAPTDYKSMMESIQIQYDCGAISRESIIKNSPYTSNVGNEIERILKENIKKS